MEYLEGALLRVLQVLRTRLSTEWLLERLLGSQQAGVLQVLQIQFSTEGLMKHLEGIRQSGVFQALRT